MFGDKGYDNTTVAEIAAAAQVSYATFFNYFTAKEDVVFADDDLYDALLAEIFAARAPDERPADLLLRTIEHLSTATSWSFPLDHELTHIRARLITEVPALRAAALLRNAGLRQRLTRALLDAYPADLDALYAAALTGAMVGAVDAVLDDSARGQLAPTTMTGIVRRAAEIGLRGHLSEGVWPEQETTRSAASRK
ncbi:TetR/AcrR family transcriptional regulator [Nocardia lijiangensis]|uniref:TetR/AcrR family transcriptional regulator n=1 Tax=Nocardia lijiangensis TaxID=299618 RepID=UPI000AC3B422|nr:TetR/AcrR family transcriptional regulator [Nocardia lijiangensis]